MGKGEHVLLARDGGGGGENSKLSLFLFFSGSGGFISIVSVVPVVSFRWLCSSGLVPVFWVLVHAIFYRKYTCTQLKYSNKGEPRKQHLNVFKQRHFNA